MLAQQNGARHSSCNGQASTESLGSMGLINRTEYIRLMQQSLLRLGYPDVASLLAQQSRIEMQPQCSTDFQQQIQRGEWDAALELLPQLTSEQQTAREVRFLVTQQKFLECLERGDTAAALKCLREELAPLQVNQEQLHRLAGLLVCSGPRDEANGNGVCTDLAAPVANSSVRRKELLQKLQELLSPSMIVPDGRLEQLVEQALLSQVHSCPYHNACHVQLSLFTDYQAGMEQLPSEQFLVLEQHQDEVWHVSFAHAGDRLASGSKDHTAIIWACNPQHRQFTRQLTLRGHSKAVTSCCWSPDDTRLLTTSHDLLVKLWNTSTGAELLSLECVLPQTLLSLSDERLFWRRHSEDQPNNDVTASCAWLPDGKHFVTGSIDKNLFLWDLEGNVLYKWKRNGRINDIAVSPDGSCVITICQEGLVNFMGLNGGQEANIRESSPVMSMAVSPDGSYLLVNLQTHMVHMYELSALLNAMSTSSNGNGSGSGSSAAAAAAGGGAGGAGAGTAPGSVPTRRRGAAVGSLLMNAALLNSSPAAASQMSGSQEELDNVIPAQPKAKFSMNDGKTARYVLHSCFGGGQSNFIAVGGEDCLVNIFSVATGECLLTLRGHSGTVNSVSWNPADPYMLATASDDKTISIWMASAAFSGRA